MHAWMHARPWSFCCVESMSAHTRGWAKAGQAWHKAPNLCGTMKLDCRACLQWRAGSWRRHWLRAAPLCSR